MTDQGCLIGLPKSGQSPIDIDDKIIRPHRFPPLILSGHWLRDGDATLFNTGKTAKICLSGDRIPSSIKGGPLSGDEYEFNEVHFHWGKENCCGSEHTINGTWFSMEAHAIHWNRRYGTLEESIKHKDGLCVLAFLFLATDKDSLWSNPQLESLTDNLRYIIKAESEKKVPADCLKWMKHCLEVPCYYTYPGSLTTPPYNECVVWIVIPQPIRISPNQIDEFRKLRNEEDEQILTNAREVQSLRGRRIFLAVNTI